MVGRRTFRVKRIAAGLLGALLLAILLFSMLELAAEADHACTGEDCQICVLIARCTDNLRRLSTGPLAPPAAAGALLVLLASAVLPAGAAFAGTPVAQKVRLNN